MIATIQPSDLKGTVQAPASKSSMQRACAAALAARGTSLISNPGHSNDDRAAMDIIRNLGAVLEPTGDTLSVTSQGVKPVGNEINCGESGLSIRMFTPLAALGDKAITVTGTGSLSSRPMHFFDEILPQLGVTVKSREGRLPIVVKGPLIPKNIEVDGSLSSQFLTGLLLAYAAAEASGVSIKVNNLKSRPYIDLTLEVMRQFGLKLPENRDYAEFCFGTATQPSAAVTRQYAVEGDWSGGAFLLVAGVIAGPITVKGLDTRSTQADKAILQALDACGAGIIIGSDAIELRPGPMRAFDFDATDCPDLFPPLVALAAYCTGATTIRGVSRLQHKESNRGGTLQQEFGKMGVEIELHDDIMQVKGGVEVKGAAVHSHHDHRIAMACAVAALKAQGKTEIAEAGAVDKSYPDFYKHLQSLGGRADINSLPVNI